MEFSEQVFELAESFMKESTYVKIEKENIEDLATRMIDDGKIYSKCRDYDVTKTILIELIASSINYCYWYGKSYVRPGNASSSTLYEIITQVFDTYDDNYYDVFEAIIITIQIALSIQRFPLLEERIKHLNELKEMGVHYALYVKEFNSSFEDCFTKLISLFPGFSSDMFLKRASLFFIQLHRELGWFKEAIHFLHTPADYHLPNILKSFKCISYDFSLNTTILLNGLIPKHSVEECEIRSATILIVKRLCELTGWNVSEVDWWLFSQKKLVNSPFHLTITTDY